MILKSLVDITYHFDLRHNNKLTLKIALCMSVRVYVIPAVGGV